jgi:hypothetical protein
MTMGLKRACILALPLALAACGDPNANPLIGKWEIVPSEDPDMKAPPGQSCRLGAKMEFTAENYIDPNGRTIGVAYERNGKVITVGYAEYRPSEMFEIHSNDSITNIASGCGLKRIG